MADISKVNINNIEYNIKDAVARNSLIYEKSASGSIISITDGGDNIPVKSLKVLVSAVQSGSGTPSPSNIRSISGWSGANVSSTGKNLFGGNTSGALFATSIPNGTTLTASMKNNSGAQFRLNLHKADQTIVDYWNVAESTGFKRTFTTTEPIEYFSISNTSGTLEEVQVEFGEDKTTYEPYKGTTHTIPFGQTVYGGVLDVIKGVLTITHGIVDLGDLSWTYDGTYVRFLTLDITDVKRVPDTSTVPNFICSIYSAVSSEDFDSVSKPNYTMRGNTANSAIFIRNTDYNDATAFKTAMSGVNLVYELDTPIVINLTPTQVKTLLTCNIFSDTGDIDTLIYFNSNADETADVVEAYVGDVVNLYATLATGSTSVTFTSSAITDNSTIEVFNDLDVPYTSKTLTSGSLTLEFDAQESDMKIKVRVS